MTGSIVHKVYQLYAHIHASVQIFPKKDRFTLGVKLEQQTLELFELVMLARVKTGASKLLILKKADFRITMIKLFIRLSFDVRALSEKWYIQIEEQLIELGKMIGGWIKYTENTKGPVKRPL